MSNSLKPSNLQSASSRFLADYESRLLQRQLVPDPAQRQAVVLLANLLDELTLAQKREQLSWLGRWRASQQTPPRGVYIWGGVGRGKTLLMDLFYIYVPFKRKKRVHFHQFMRQTHADIHAWRLMHGGAGNSSDDPIPPLADKIASETRVLCFDEMQVTDVTDAMLIRRLFDALTERGVHMVITSNRPPQDLYLNGLQRNQFLPFIERLQQEYTVFELASPIDYRRRQVEALGQVYYAPLDAEAVAWLDGKFAILTRGQPVSVHTHEVQGRILDLPHSCGEVTLTSFDAMCHDARGTADYSVLAANYSSVLLANIPCMTPENRNESKRFVLLVDVLYEAKVKLVCTAQARPDELYTAGDGSFEFERTASRLIEMQSREYLDATWQPPQQ